jgi:hypothetical protein
MTSENKKKRKTATEDEETSLATEPITPAECFKAWLGVKSGAHMDAIEATLRQENPGIGAAQLRELADAELRKADRQRKSAHARYMSDDKACRLLLNAYFGSNDQEALRVYMQYQTDFIRRKFATKPSVVPAQLAAVTRALETCARQMRDKKFSLASVVEVLLDKHAAWERNEVPIEDLRQSLLLSQQLAPAEQDSVDTLPRMLGIDGKVSVGAPPGSGDLHSVAEFVSSFTADLSNSAEQTQKRHLSEMARTLASAINLTAALVEVAPANAVFMDFDGPQPETSHPVELMQKILTRALPDQKVEPEQLSRYVTQWTRTQNESQEDVDQAIANMHNFQERETIVRDMLARGVSEEEAQAAMAHSIDPANSPFMTAVSQFIMDEEFQRANEEAQQNAKGGSTADSTSAASLAQKKMETAHQLEECSRSHLARFMREPLGEKYGERPCANSFNCVCMMLTSSFPMIGANLGGFVARDVAGNGSTVIGGMLGRDAQAKKDDARAKPQPVKSRLGFVCREFLLPSQEATFQRTRELPRSIQLCLLCNRRETTMLYYQAMQQRGPGNPLMPVHTLQNHSVRIDEKGEYDKSACLKTEFDNHQFTGIVKPFIGFSASHYDYATVVEHGHTLSAIVEKSALDFRPASASATRT